MVTIIKPEICVRCKGRLWCGLSKCPLLEARKIVKTFKLGDSLEGYSPPSLLIGWSGYPDVNVTPLVTRERPEISDNPPLWAEKNVSIDEILDLRLRMGGGSKRINVRDQKKLTFLIQEIAMSRKPVATDVEFERPPKLTVSYSNLFPPIGFRGSLRSLQLAESPRVDKRVEKFYYDEVKAREAVISLYERGYDVYDLSRYLSAGIFGIEKRLVPTRWSITAVDSMISQYLYEKIVNYPPVERVLLFYSNLYDNHFFIFFLPGSWAFELVEAWAPKSFWASGKRLILSDHEIGRPRSDYASNVGGSYYASRLAVLEKLFEMRRKATVIILREVREGYYAPLGVWQVRENVRHALRKKPIEFDDLNSALNYAWKHLGMRIKPEEWKEKSVLLKGRQMTLF